MIRPKFGLLVRVAGVLALSFAALSAFAAGNTISKWRVVGIISEQSSPFTTAAYFPRPLVAGDLVEMTFRVKTATPATYSYGSYAAYEGAISSVKVVGSNWSIKMRSPLQRGAISITNDDPDYGDSLGMVATTALIPGITWYQIDFGMSNPGGPSPGVGPWQPFISLALPKIPPSLGFFPNSYFYIQARRDQAGQPVDGAAYYGQVLSITLVKKDDDENDDDN